MILEPIEVTEGGVTFNRIINPNVPYWICTHSSKWIIFQSQEDSPIEGGNTDTRLDVFGATTYAELLEEITRLGLVP